MNKDKDILEVIPDEDLLLLAKMYEPHQNWAPQAYSVIRTAIKWKSMSNKPFFTFYSPNSCWKKDGTFIVLMKIAGNDIFVFTLEDSCKSLYEALSKSNILNGCFSKDSLFFAVSSRHIETVLKIIQERGLNILTKNKYDLFFIEKEKVLNLQIDCPEEVEVRKLSKDNVELINSLWPHRFPGSENYILALIEFNEGFGLFLKETQELVAWSLLSCLGQLTMVQCVDHHKKKGYASIVTLAASKLIAENGHYPIGTIFEKNVPSKNMFRKLGFRNIDATFYISLNKNIQL